MLAVTPDGAWLVERRCPSRPTVWRRHRRAVHRSLPQLRRRRGRPGAHDVERLGPAPHHPRVGRARAPAGRVPGVLRAPAAAVRGHAGPLTTMSRHSRRVSSVVEHPALCRRTVVSSILTRGSGLVTGLRVPPRPAILQPSWNRPWLPHGGADDRGAGGTLRRRPLGRALLRGPRTDPVAAYLGQPAPLLARALRRVAFIRTAQRIGVTLAEIAEALANLPQSRTQTKADWARLSKRILAGPPGRADRRPGGVARRAGRVHRVRLPEPAHVQPGQPGRRAGRVGTRSGAAPTLGRMARAAAGHAGGPRAAARTPWSPSARSTGWAAGGRPAGRSRRPWPRRTPRPPCDPGRG